MDSLTKKASGAAKWSLLTELLARIITPVTQIILARLLAPEAFGVLATVVMINSFATMLSESSFAKYLIQREFQDDAELDRNANVAFWSGMALTMVLFVLLAVFRDFIATVVGSPGLGVPLLVAACAIPLMVVVSTQNALFRRAFEYKRILPIRVGAALVTLAVAVPCALLGFGYWSLIFGVLGTALTQAVLLTLLSAWKPRLFFSFAILREMFSFSGWALFEALSIWMTTWAGTFIVGNLLSQNELGLYRQPITIINGVFALVVQATTPILFASLSRLQHKRVAFREFLLNFQTAVALILFPLGVGAFFFRDFLTLAALGPQWSEASLMVGLWSLSSALVIVLSNFISTAFRALGKPSISLVSQVVYMLIMVPALYLAALDGFVTLVIVNAVVRALAIIIKYALAYFVANISFISSLKQLRAPLIGVAAMSLAAVCLANESGTSWIWSCISIAVCAVLYTGVVLCFRQPRAWIRQVTVQLVPRRVV